MTHLPYIIPAFVIAVALPLFLGIESALRLRAAQKRLAALEPRKRAAQ
jgi:hypothetical protein